MNQPASGYVRYRTKNDRFAIAARWAIAAAVAVWAIVYFCVGA